MKVVYMIIIILILTLTLTYSILHGSTKLEASGQTSLSSIYPIAVCSPEKIIVRTGDTISIHAYVTKQNDLSYEWTTTGGKISGQGNAMNWNFTGVKPGIYEAIAHIKEISGNNLSCSAEVIVIDPRNLKGGKNITVRDFLVRGESETEGYGLYSYLLLGSRPANASREKYLCAIKEYLRLSSVTELLKVLKDKKQLNVTYLPTKIAMGEDLLVKIYNLDERNINEVAAWVLDHYDYERAKVLLKKIQGDYTKGPYIFSFLKPVSYNDVDPPYLIQDQTNVPPKLISLWINEFIIQAAKEKYWEERTMQMLGLRIRVYLGYVGDGIPEVGGAFEKMISLKKKLKIGS
jgi:hypothetical protein